MVSRSHGNFEWGNERSFFFFFRQVSIKKPNCLLAPWHFSAGSEPSGNATLELHSCGWQGDDIVSIKRCCRDFSSEAFTAQQSGAIHKVAQQFLTISGSLLCNCTLLCSDYQLLYYTLDLHMQEFKHLTSVWVFQSITFNYSTGTTLNKWCTLPYFDVGINGLVQPR